MSYITIKLRRGTAAQWTAQNPVLSEGEIGLETDTRKFKAGDGTTAWTGLQYYGGSGGGATLFTDLTDVPQSYTGQGGKLVRVKADASGLEFYTLTISSGDVTTALGFTPENVANKKTTLADNSDTFYPSQKAVKTAVDAKQDTLVSGTNIKTINGNSVLGGGDIVISAGADILEIQVFS